MFLTAKQVPNVIVSVHPNYPTCHQQMIGYAQFTPTVDILAATCSGNIYYNGILLGAGRPQDVCMGRHTPFHCPIIKGVTQKVSWPLSIPCFILNLKGRYSIEGYCVNYDGSMIGCVQYNFTWHGTADSDPEIPVRFKPFYN
ncbi:uncharacterized protein LOC110246835 [Exaiptasia diaphana]|uniref:MD-2-related lipid-recognition domain-containing protein n=1 Tax=Exaiptasia diaphana TaxID=2652724 RepID=A0A913XS71_EXADI|nr:uncharacterized protein LOC110246835 [Exaiptasia diaphana]